ncbi:hypothetical protein ACFS6H_15105 [Terrimonas rubra]|uniref:Uncharacterized protein n=1 Tax=Terrimonas rubra TaxID=1035890 RepID=A0ABW6A711_9BACT
MSWKKILSIVSVIGVVAACFLPWASINSLQVTINGIRTEGTGFGKPGYLHLSFVILFVITFLIRSVGAKRIGLIFVGLNFAWAIRNFIVIGSCEAGECPEKLSGLYMLLVFSVTLLISGLFPDITLKEEKK